MSKTTEQRIEEIMKEVKIEVDSDCYSEEILKQMLENLILSAKLDQLKESK